MKKNIVVLTLLSAILFVSSCTNPFASLKDYKVDGYIEAPELIYTTTLDQNKLGGTLMFVDGRVTKIDQSSTPCYHVETAKGIMVFLIAQRFNNWKSLNVEDNIRTYFQYMGVPNITGVYIAHIDPKNIPDEIPADILSAKAEYAKPVTIPEEIPTYVTYLYNNFDRVLAQNDFSFSLDKGSLIKSSSWGNYSFSVSDKAHSKIITFLSNGDDGTTQKAFIIDNHFRTDRNGTEELVTIIFMATNPSLDQVSAAALTKEMINSYHEGGPSKVIESGNYLIFIESDGKQIKAVHKDQIFNVDKSLYAKAEYKAIKRGEHGNKRVYITGTVADISTEWNSILGTHYIITFNGDEGNIYHLKYYFDNIPIVMEKWDRYIAYGTVMYVSDEPYTLIKLERLRAK